MMVRRLARVLVLSAASTALVGCGASAVTCSDIAFGPRATVRGIGVGDGYDPSKFALREGASPSYDAQRRVRIPVQDDVTLVVSGVDPADPRGGRVELIELGNGGDWSGTAGACLPRMDRSKEVVLGTVEPRDRVALTKYPNVYLRSRAEVELPPSWARVAIVYFGPDADALRAGKLIPNLSDRPPTPDEELAMIQRAMRLKEANSKAADARAAREREAARLTPAEQARFKELGELAQKADKRYREDPDLTPDHWARQQAMYSTPGTHGLSLEDAIRVHYMGRAQWDEWNALAARNRLANGK